MISVRWFLTSIAIAVLATACSKKSEAPTEASPSPSASGAGKEETIQVGLIASLTGKFSALGSENKKAVELAIEQVNADGGLLGKKLALVTRDDQTLPDQSVLAYNDIKTSDVVAIIGSA